MTSVWVILETDDASHPDGDVVIVTRVQGVYEDEPRAREALKWANILDHALDYRLVGPVSLNQPGAWT